MACTEIGLCFDAFISLLVVGFKNAATERGGQITLGHNVINRTEPTNQLNAFPFLQRCRKQ